MLGKALQNRADAHNVCALELFAVRIHRMAGKIEPRRLALELHELIRCKLGKVRHVHLRNRCVVVASAEVKEPDLPVDILALSRRDGVHDRLINLQQLRAFEPEAVARAAFDQILERALVEVRAVHPLAEVLEPCKRSLLLAVGHDLLDKSAPDVFNCGKAKADPAGNDGKMVVRLVDIGRQHGNSHRLTLGNILGNLR